jgi:hypothetical protein
MVVGDRGGAEAELSLAGGRSGEPATIRLVDEGSEVWLILNLPPEGDISRQRTFRAAISALDRIATKLGAEAPGAAAAISACIEQCIVGRSDPARNSQHVFVWNQQTPSGNIRFRRGLLIPVVTVARTTRSFEALGHNFANAETWLLQRERSRSRGFRQQTLDANRTYTMRGPAQLTKDKQYKAAFRYAETGTVRMGKHGTVGDDGSWFWEVAYRQRQAEDGRQEAILSVNSLSRSQDVLYYGAELARFLSAFVWQVRELDPSADFQTVGLRV